MRQKLQIFAPQRLHCVRTYDRSRGLDRRIRVQVCEGKPLHLLKMVQWQCVSLRRQNVALFCHGGNDHSAKLRKQQFWRKAACSKTAEVSLHVLLGQGSSGMQ